MAAEIIVGAPESGGSERPGQRACNVHLAYIFRTSCVQVPSVQRLLSGLGEAMRKIRNTPAESAREWGVA